MKLVGGVLTYEAARMFWQTDGLSCFSVQVSHALLLSEFGTACICLVCKILGQC